MQLKQRPRILEAPRGSEDVLRPQRGEGGTTGPVAPMELPQATSSVGPLNPLPTPCARALPMVPPVTPPPPSLDRPTRQDTSFNPGSTTQRTIAHIHAITTPPPPQSRRNNPPHNIKHEPPDKMTFKQAPKTTQNIIIKVHHHLQQWLEAILIAARRDLSPSG